MNVLFDLVHIRTLVVMATYASHRCIGCLGPIKGKVLTKYSKIFSSETRGWGSE